MWRGFPVSLGTAVVAVDWAVGGVAPFLLRSHRVQFGCFIVNGRVVIVVGDDVVKKTTLRKLGTGVALVCAVCVCSASTSVLHVASRPDGVVINIDPADMLGMATGETPFSRAYTNGTIVSLHAPANMQHEGSDYIFKMWLRNGVPFTLQQTVEMTLLTETTMTATYAMPLPPVAEMTVRSFPAGRATLISVAPADIEGQGNGYTPFIRLFEDSASVTLTAPPVDSAGWRFDVWVRDGMPFTTNRTFTVPLFNNITCDAYYQESPPQPESLGTVIWVR